jgi:hypothetical protein
LLDDGRVRYTPPDGWNLVSRQEDGLGAVYNTSDGIGVISILVQPQQESLRPEQSHNMALRMGKEMRESAEKNHVEFLIPPRVQEDPRFMLKLHAQMRVPDRGVVDELHLFRAMGTNLVYVNATAQTDSEEAARAVHEAGETLLAQAKIGSGPKPALFGRTRVRLLAPADWIVQRVDHPNGIVATFREPDNGPSRIIVRSRVVPKAADEAARAKLLDEMESADRATAPVPGLIAQGEPEVKPGSGQVRRTMQRSFTGGGRTWRATTQYIAVGDVLLGVSSVAPEEHAEEIEKLAGEMGEKAESLDRGTR